MNRHHGDALDLAVRRLTDETERLHKAAWAVRDMTLGYGTVELSEIKAGLHQVVHLAFRLHEVAKEFDVVAPGSPNVQMTRPVSSRRGRRTAGPSVEPAAPHERADALDELEPTDEELAAIEAESAFG